MPSVTVSISQPAFFAGAMALILMTASVARVRRIDLSRSAALLALAGLVCVGIAAGEPLLSIPRRGSIAVLVDLSPSTRGATFRDPASLRQRLHELLGTKPFQLHGFAQTVRPLDMAAPFLEMPADETRFQPVPADAIVLFSDARFAMPSAASPTYIVADIGLESPADASITGLRIVDHAVEATIVSASSPRIATFSHATGPSTAPVYAGNIVISRPMEKDAASVGVSLNPGDLWPENDAMDLRVAPPLFSRSWWIGARAPSGDWTAMTPARVPENPAEFIAPSIIVLDNVRASDLDDAKLDRITQYVRDLGGALLILGGDHAFASGGYPGSALEALSPLASSPPTPATHWLLVADASGSMSEGSGGVSRFSTAAAAIDRLLPLLPPNDIVDVGEFSDRVRWWSRGKNGTRTAALTLPPPDASPRGPTNLEPALRQIADETDPSLPTRLLVLSDFDARIDQSPALINELRRKKIQLNGIAIENGAAMETVRVIALATGGRLVEQFDPSAWFASIRDLARSAMPGRWIQRPATIEFLGSAGAIPAVSVTDWNQVWLKKEADALAQTKDESPPLPMAASWRVGRGRVAALAFSPSLDQARAIADLFRQPPRDPRFSVTWEMGPRLAVIVDAVDQGRYLNDLSMTIDLQDGPDAQSLQLKQTAPGRYETRIPWSNRSQLATLRHESQIIDREPLAGRYPPEFDAIGNDHAAMRELAERTGGAVIWPNDRGPIDFRWPVRHMKLTPWLCAAGILLIASALVAWRLR